MHVLLFLAGLVAVLAGSAALALGLNEFRMGAASTLLIPGAAGAVGGFILLGLGSIVARLRRIAEALESGPVPRNLPVTEPQAAKSTSSDTPTPEASRVEPPTAAPAVAVEPAPTPAAPEPQKDAAPEVKSLASALDIVQSPPEWPRVEAVDRLAADTQNAPPPPPVAAAAEPEAASRQDQDLKPATAAAVIKSGVIEGMAYSVYSDGAIEAELPQGVMRFASIAEWRGYMRDRS